MKKSILICVVLAAAAVSNSPGQSNNSKSPCGVAQPSADEMKIEWRLAAETDSQQYLYNTRKKRCTPSGVLKVVLKVVEKGQTAFPGISSYQILQAEFKCRTDKMRLTAITTYISDGSVLLDRSFPKAKWEHVPNSTFQTMLNNVCHK